MRPPEPLARGRRMQRDVMKYRLDRMALEFAQYRLTIDTGRQNNVIDMAIVLAIRRHDRAAEPPPLLERFEHDVVALPDRDPLARDAFGLFEVRPQECGVDVAWQK